MSLVLTALHVFQIHRYVNNNLGEDPEAQLRETSPAMSPPLANTEAKPSNTVSMLPPRRIAVAIKSAWKQYGSGKKATPVLQNLSMTVPEGTM